MAEDPRRLSETPTARANKASAMRWAIGIVVLFAVGLVAWWMSDPRGEAPELTPDHQPGYEQNSDGNQPPAVIPNQDTGGTAPATPEPAAPGTQ